MANRYANLVGSNKIKDEYTKINTGFDKVQQEMDAKPDRSIAQVNDVQMGTDDTLTIEGSTGITISTNPAQKKVTITATGTSTPGPHGPSHNNDGADPIPDLQNLTNEFDAHKADKAAHGATSVATANSIVSRDSNGTANFASVRAVYTPADASTPITNYPDGVSYTSVLTSNGWPVLGTEITVKHSNDRNYQIVVENGAAGNPRAYIRSWHSTPNAWTAFLRLITSSDIMEGAGSPEGVVTALPSTIYRRTDTGELWVKKTGTGNTGWGQVAVS